MEVERAQAWSGDDWQAYCELLFQKRHEPAGYVRVPDRDRGDLGVEGFTIDGSGCIYQCYASEAVELRARYEAQRDKITRDLGKLVKNRLALAQLFGTHKMRNWILVVPWYDSKDLVMHARRKEEEIRAKKLAFLTDDFTVSIQTDEANFAAERRAIEDAAAASVTVAPEGVHPQDVESFKTEQATQVAAMNTKLAKILPAATVSELRERLLRQALDGDNIREHLRRNHPETLERVLVQHQIEERNILAERDFQQLHKGSVPAVRQRYEDSLRNRVPGLGDAQSSRLSHAAVARWLLECPLDFPDQP